MKRIPGIIVTGALVAVFAGAGLAADQHGHGGNGMGQMQGDMKGGMMKGGMQNGMMQQMMNEPHHKLAMAYKKNLVTFAQALKSQVEKTEKVDRQFAETAVEEMKRSLGQMKSHHDEHVKMISDEMKQQMGEKMKMMENRFATVQQHLDMLDKEVKAEVPDPKKVMAEINQITKQCDMMKMEKMHQKKSKKEKR